MLKYLNKSKINNIQIQFFFIFKKLDMINYLLYVNKYFSHMKKTKNFINFKYKITNLQINKKINYILIYI